MRKIVKGSMRGWSIAHLVGRLTCRVKAEETVFPLEWGKAGGERGVDARASLEAALTEMAVLKMVEYEDLKSCNTAVHLHHSWYKVHLNISQILGRTFSGRHVSMVHCIS